MMKVSRKMTRAVGLLMLVLILPFSNICVAENAQEMLEKVKKKYDSIKDAELKFSQQVKFEFSKREQNVSGTLLIKKENKYRVETEGHLIVTDGSTVWSYSQQNKQVLIDKFKVDERALTPERILAAAPKDYYASVVGTEKVGKTETQILKLVPKDDDSIVQTMTLWVDESTWLIKKVEIVDVNGKQTVYTVNDIKVNIGIPDSRFTYQIPNGVEAVDLR
jgi:outer membrane lipoprotein carrier protein